MHNHPHTKGKIRVGGAERRDLRTEDDKCMAFCPVYHGSIPYEEQHANVRRLAALWNGCDGISTEALEDGGIAELIQGAERLQTADQDFAIRLILRALAKLRGEG